MSMESLVPKSSASSIFIKYIIYIYIYLFPQTLNRWNPDNLGLHVLSLGHFSVSANSMVKNTLVFVSMESLVPKSSASSIFIQYIYI